MAPGTIVRYTGQGGGFRWDAYGIDVDSASPLEVVAPDVADLVDADPSIPLEKYPDGDVNTDLTIVDGLDINPESIHADGDITTDGSMGTANNPNEEGNFDAAFVGTPSATPNKLKSAERQVEQGVPAVVEKTKVLDSADLSWTTQNLYWGCLVDAASVFDNPIDKLYLYYSEDHTDSGIALATASDPMGTWTDYGSNPIFEESGQVETARVVADPANDRAILYYHSNQLGTTQSTGYAFVSGDGTSISDQGLLFDEPANTPGDGHTGYFNPFKLGEKFGAYHLMGGGTYPRWGLSHSDDGINWTTDPRPLGYEVDATGDNDRRVCWHESNLLRYNGGVHLIGSNEPFISGGSTGSQKRVSTAPLSQSLRHLSGGWTELISPTESWEGTATYAPFATTYQSRPYVVYSSDGKIGIVRLEGGVL